MHEISIVEGALNAIEKEAKTRNVTEIIKIKVKVGESAHVKPDSFRLCFEELAKGTMAEGAQLELETTSGREIKIESIEAEKDE